jgi:hypothetical protein
LAVKLSCRQLDAVAELAHHRCLVNKDQKSQAFPRAFPGDLFGTIAAKRPKQELTHRVILLVRQHNREESGAIYWEVDRCHLSSSFRTVNGWPWPKLFRSDPYFLRHIKPFSLTQDDSVPFIPYANCHLRSSLGVEHLVFKTCNSKISSRAF